MEFRSRYAYLSDLYFCKNKIEIDLLGEAFVFNNAAAAFQAHKTKSKTLIHLLTKVKSTSAKDIGRHIKIDYPDWDARRIAAMRRVQKAKFEQNPYLYDQLQDIPGMIVHDNNWKDDFWGVYNGSPVGKNVLGLILMEVRDDEEYLDDTIIPPEQRQYKKKKNKKASKKRGKELQKKSKTK